MNQPSTPLRVRLALPLLLVCLLAFTACAQEAPATATTASNEVVSTDSEATENEGTEAAGMDDASDSEVINPDETTAVDDAAVTSEQLAINEGETMKTASGLEYTEVQAGTGPAAQAGDIVAVHYTGTLTNGVVFDSSYQRNEPIQFPLGAGRVIPGWDEGISLMKQGGKARLTIPPELGYGAQGAGGVIPPNATLIFEVELVNIMAGAPANPTAVAEDAYTTTASGLKYYDFEVGDGASPQQGQTVVVHYTGWLEDGGTKFDSSLDRGQPFAFSIGVGQVIPGWDEGVLSMNVGGKRQLVIPSDLAYGSGGAGGGVIPPNATLIFEVELLDIQ